MAANNPVEVPVFFTSFQISDIQFLVEAAGNTLLISTIAIVGGTFLGIIVGWLLSLNRLAITFLLSTLLDFFRSVPLIIQLILFYNFLPIIALPLSPFAAGSLVLIFYTAAMVASVARGGIEAVPITTRKAARSLGLTYRQDLFYIVFPIGLRAVLPAWVGVALSVLKDSALVSVLGYVELLRASRILTTRTQEPFIILAIAGCFYFALSYPISKISSNLEKRWKE